MTLKDAGGIMAVLETAYPMYYAKKSQQERMEAARLYAELFADDSASLVYAAVKAIIVSDDSAFPPSIGAIKSRMQSLTHQEELSDGEAWALVSRACSNGLYGYQKEFDRLPPAVQAAVGRPEQLREWGAMDSQTVQSVVASNFMRSYRICAQREREKKMLPESVRRLIESMTTKMAFPEERGRDEAGD